MESQKNNFQKKIPKLKLNEDFNEIWSKYSEEINMEPISAHNEKFKEDGFVRFVLISDTHEVQGWVKNVPEGDVLIHSGDFTMLGRKDEVQSFVQKLESLPHKYKIVVAGNHELTFDTQKFKFEREDVEKRFPILKGVNDVEIKELVSKNPNIIYLENTSSEVLGFKVYGNPYQPYFFDWGFNESRSELKNVWKQIPKDSDIIVTHGPPLGAGDRDEDMITRLGDEDLLVKIREVKPMLHVFGHIHPDYGVWQDNQNTIYVNASICDNRYNANRKGIVIDLKPKTIQ